jgi:hypothetical protein
MPSYPVRLYGYLSPGSGDQQGYHDVLACRGGADVCVKDLVVAENRRVRVRAAPVIRERPGRVTRAGSWQQRGRGPLSAAGAGRTRRPPTRVMIGCVWPRLRWAVVTNDTIMTVHATINGWTRDELVGALSYWQGTRRRTSSGSGKAASGTRPLADQTVNGSTRSASAGVVAADASAGDPDVFRLGSLLALGDVELDLLPFL